MFSLIMVVAVFALNKIVQSVSAKSIVFYILLAIFSVLLIEVLYGMLMLIFGFPSDFFAAMFLVALPSFVYDLIPLLILAPIVRIFIKPVQVEVESQPVDIV